MSNELTDIHVLSGPEAALTLNIYAEELENQRGGDLSNSQIDFLIRTARLLSQVGNESGDVKLKLYPPRFQSDEV